MEITKLIDAFGDDIFALALIITKNFDSAKQVFVKTATAYEQFPENAELIELVRRAYAECAEADSNEGAAALTGVELDPKRQAVLEELLLQGEMTRVAVHMFYENDLDEKQIAEITGQSEKHVSELLEELPDGLKISLEKHYKHICSKIAAEDKLKAYVIRAVSSGNKRLFEVRNDAVPVHRWKTSHKIIVFVAALIITSLICFVIPIAVEYYYMREREGFSSFENLSPGESFYITEEAETSA